MRLLLHHGDLTRLLAARAPASTRSSPTRSTTSARSRTSASPSTSPSTPTTSPGMGTVRLLEAIRDARRRAALLPGVELGDVRRHRRRRRTRPRRFIRAARTPWPRSRRTGSPSTTASPTGCTRRNGILFNHESERRGETFVTRKITRALARIQLGLQDKLFLGNLDAKRDWGYAPDFTDAMWRMLQQDEPDDYVIATGEMHSVREFLDEAGAVPRDGLGGRRRDRSQVLPPGRGRRAAAAMPSKAREKLGWEPTVTFKELVRIMVESDVKALEDRLAGRGVRVGRELSPTAQFWDGKAVVVTGGAGFLGRAVVRDLDGARRRRDGRPLGRPRPARSARARARRSTAPTVVIHLAANVGGIGFNRANPAPLVYDNMMMAANIFEAVARRRRRQARERVHGVRLPEVHGVALLRGRPLGRLPGGVQRALRAGQEDDARALRRLPAPVRLRLLRADRRQPLRARRQLRPRELARHRGDDPQVRRGPASAATSRSCSGAPASPSREFLYVDDAARALAAGRRAPRRSPTRSTSAPAPRPTSATLAETIERLVGYDGETVWDASRPDGQPRRFLDVSRARELMGFEARVPLEDGLRETIESFRAQHVAAS